MQLVHCVVKHGGKHHSAVKRLYVSVAEIIVLRKIHGDDAIEDITVKYAGIRKPGFDEMDYLTRTYGGKDETLQMIQSLFPGAVPTFPSRLSDIGISNVGEPAEGEAEPVYDHEAEEREAKDATEKAEAEARLRARAIEAAQNGELIAPPPRNTSGPRGGHKDAIAKALG